MKKFLRTLIAIFLLVIILSYLEANLDMIGIFAFKDITSEEMANYNGYYYKQLTLLQKQIYVKIDKKSKECESKVTLGNQDLTTIEEDVNRALSAFIYDNPQYFNLENNYGLTHTSLILFNLSTLNLEYIYDDVNIFRAKTKQLEETVQNMLEKVVEPDMTDYEKELAIHDELVDSTNYYMYDEIENIPAITHTAYAALVEKETVCDGFSKAFKILLEEENIESIIVSGKAEDEAHAWNMVKLDNEYYNVDVTSDSIQDGNQKYLIHRYFNISNDRIKLTHTFNEMFQYPDSIEEKYNYYIYNDFVLDASDNIYSKLSEIASKQEKTKALELMIDSRYYIQNIINTLYDMNFNDWKTNGQRKVQYLELEDIYVFAK